MDTRARSQAIDFATSLNPMTDHILWSAGIKASGAGMFPRTFPRLFPLGVANSNRPSEPPGWVVASAKKDLRIKDVLLADLRSMMPVDYAFQKAAESYAARAEIESNSENSTGIVVDDEFNPSSAGSTGILNVNEARTSQEPVRNNVGSIYRTATTKPLPSAAAVRAASEDELLPPYGYEAQSFNDIDMSLKPLCSLCDTVPRIEEDDQAFVHECSNGHLLCNICTKNICKVKLGFECPICRTVTKSRNRFAEAYILKFLARVPTKCRHLTCQCQIKMINGLLGQHERYCVHRETDCVAPKCTFWGPQNTLFRHLRTGGCVQVLTDLKWDEKILCKPNDSGIPVTYFFGHRVDDFPPTSQSIMKRQNTTTTWRPIVLVARGLLAACLSLFITRRASGEWALMVFSKLPAEDLHHVKCKITVGNKDNNHCFSSCVLGPETTRERARQKGEYLSLSDVQVIKFSGKDNKIFDYQVEITPDPGFVEKLNKNVIEGSQCSMSNEIELLRHHERPSDLEDAIGRIITDDAALSAAMAVA